MWDRFLPSSSSTTTVTTVAAALPLPDARLSLRSGAGIHKPRLSRLRGAYRHSRSDDAHDPINALGISNGPLRYEIRHGKVVPQAAHRDISLSSRHPAREPLRERTQQASLPRTPASPSQQFVCEASDSDGTQDSDKASPKSLFGLATGDMYRHTAEEQVSPPSSPDLDHAGVGRLVDDVSPIDDELDLARSIGAHDAVRHHASHASATSYHHRKPPAATLPMTSHQPRWSKAARRPLNAQHRPAQLAAAHLDEANGSRRVDGPSYDMSGHGSSSGPMPAPTGRPTRVPPAILGQRRRLVAQNKPEPIDTRPPWKGASGRSKILSPVRDDLNVAPLRLPPKGAQPASRGTELLGAASTGRPSPETSEDGTARPQPLTSNRIPSGGSPVPRQPPPSYPSPAEPDVFMQPPPLAADRTSWSASVPESPSALVATIRRKPPPFLNARSIAQTRAPASARPESTPPRDRTGGPAADGASSSKDTRLPPASRFSVTTYATSNPATPRQSSSHGPAHVPAGPAQPLTAGERQTRSCSADYTDRLLSEDDAAFALTTDAYTNVGRFESPTARPRDRTSQPRTMMGENAADCRSSVFSLTKPLPPAPPELASSDDRIEQLNVRMQSLAHRRINLNKSIQHMTELMPIDSLFASHEVLRKREVEKAKVRALKDELAEVQREEYDLGLKLHRAYKRLDKDAEYEQSTLWVRRVTG